MKLQFIKNLLNTLVAISLAVSSISVLAGGGHAHGTHQEEEEKGPNGGKLLQMENFILELKIFEQGVPPEMRLYGYLDNTPINVDELSAKVSLVRLGGRTDNISFKGENNYLVGDIEIVEPHSFNVTVEVAYKGKNFHWHFESHEGRAEISDRLLEKSDVEVGIVGERKMTFTDTLFGVIEAPQDQIFNVHAPYPGIVKSVEVSVGEKVSKGQVVANLYNSKTLQNYEVTSPANGEVSEVMVNSGDAATEQPLLQIVNLEKVWVNLSAFPENIEKLKIGQEVRVYDLHQHEKATSTISYISPQMTGGHIARARTVIDNKNNHWRPGMHVKADIVTKTKTVAMAVKKSGIQSFRDMPVVFAKFGNFFEVRMIELGEDDGEYVEVLGGIEPETDYVTSNSFLLKAEVLKDGASHDH